MPTQGTNGALPHGAGPSTGNRLVAPPPGVGPTYDGPDAWAGTAGQRDGAMYCADQVRIPPQLETVVREFTKAVLRERPSDVIAFGASWFAQQTSTS